MKIISYKKTIFGKINLISFETNEFISTCERYWTTLFSLIRGLSMNFAKFINDV
jgi:hypothetical protein